MLFCRNFMKFENFEENLCSISRNLFQVLFLRKIYGNLAQNFEEIRMKSQGKFSLFIFLMGWEGCETYYNVPENIHK